MYVSLETQRDNSGIKVLALYATNLDFTQVHEAVFMVPQPPPGLIHEHMSISGYAPKIKINKQIKNSFGGIWQKCVEIKLSFQKV